LESGRQELNLIPSKNIVFNGIYLDGVEQVDYEIFQNGEIVLRLNIVDFSGNLEFNYVDVDYNEYSEKYDYFSDVVKT